VNHIPSEMTPEHIIATMTVGNIVAFDTVVEFVIPLVVLLTSTREE
jgi:hypothetical protein